MNETVFKVEIVYKEYNLGTIGYGTLYQDIQSFFAKIRGKEDPNSLISGKSKNRISKTSFLALNNVSFEINKGEAIGIIGKNGAGKSTLLKILSRITTPTSGIIKIKGRVSSLLEVGTGFHPELTGKENIYLNGTILGMKKKEIDNKFDEIIDFAGIKDFINTPVKRYSSGMYVRLAFSVAAHLLSDVLILDEVLAVGDIEFQKKCLGKMNDVALKEGRTVLFVSHSMAAIKSLCKKVMLLNSGILEYFGETDLVISKYLSNNDNPNHLIQLSDFSPKYYTGEIDILSIELLNHVGNEFAVKWDEPIRLKIRTKVNKDIEGIYFGLTITSMDQSVIFSVSNYYNGLLNIKKIDDYEIEIIIYHRLRAGVYNIHFGVVKREIEIWWGTYLTSINVINQGNSDYPDRTSGVVFCDSEWKYSC